MTNPRKFKLENSLFSETVIPLNDFTLVTFSPSLQESQSLSCPSEYSCDNNNDDKRSHIDANYNVTDMNGHLSASETLERCSVLTRYNIYFFQFMNYNLVLWDLQ